METNKVIEKVERATNWYQEKRGFYKRLAIKVELMIKEILELENITYLDVVSRAKDIESFKKKAGKDKYPNPEADITDLSGIRIIAYFESDVNKICKIIEREFNIIPKHYVDKSKELETNKVGYRSIHYVAEFSKQRLKLPEFKRFEGYCFEIQVRTVLQHAWAEIEHDRGYKFEGDLPEKNNIKRRFALLAGVLELADKEFDSIARDIDQYARDSAQDIKQGDLDITIDTTSLREYLLSKFSQLIGKEIEPEFGSGTAKEVVKELRKYGVYTLQELDNIIKPDLKVSRKNNFTSLIRTIMMADDISRYFSTAWNENWKYIDEEKILELHENGIDITQYIEKGLINEIPA